MARESNPIRRYKLRHDLTYPALAQALGISEDYAKKLGAGLVTSVSIGMAKQIEARTKGELTCRELMRWAEENYDPDGDGARAA